MLYLKIQDTPCKKPDDIPYQLADVCEVMYEITPESRELCMEIRNEDLDRTIQILNKLWARVGMGFQVIDHSDEIYTLALRFAPVIRTAEPVAERRETRSVGSLEAAMLERVMPTPAPAPTLTPTPSPEFRVIPRPSNTYPSFPHFDEVMKRLAIPETDIMNHLMSIKGVASEDNSKARLELVTRYNRLILEMAATKRALDKINQVRDNDPELSEIVGQIKRLKQGMPDNKLEDIFLTQHYIVVQTLPIVATNSNNGKKYNIGRLQFVINLATIASDRSGQQIGIEVWNMDQILVRGADTNSWGWAPHTGIGGSCFGNATDLIVEAIARKDIITLVDIMIRFYENPNMNDSQGRLVTYWPEVANV